MHPIIAKIGHFTIYSDGMMVAIAFLFGIFIAKREAVRKNIRPDLVYDLGFYLLIGSIIGARIYYILFFGLKDFLAEPASIFKVWQGGLAIHGGIFGGVITGIIFAVLAQIIHSGGAYFTMDYYTNEEYIGIWSQLMMPEDGALGTKFFITSLLFNLIAGVFYTTFYIVTRASIPGKKFFRKGLFYELFLIS